MSEPHLTPRARKMSGHVMSSSLNSCQPAGMHRLRTELAAVVKFRVSAQQLTDKCGQCQILVASRLSPSERQPPVTSRASESRPAISSPVGEVDVSDHGATWDWNDDDGHALCAVNDSAMESRSQEKLAEGTSQARATPRSTAQHFADSGALVCTPMHLIRHLDCARAQLPTLTGHLLPMRSLAERQVGYSPFLKCCRVCRA